MVAPPLFVRSPQSPEELTAHIKGYVEVAQSFYPELLLEDASERLIHRLLTLPGYRLEQVRNAYRAGELVGGYRIYERMLRVGMAHVATGCIAGVYTLAHARNQGVATALMHDAIVYAQEHCYALLLLDGIPKFYHRYGFCDVYDLTTQELDPQEILALPESPYTVRKATLGDAGQLLVLYERNFGPYTGCFVRSLEQQAHWMQHIEPEKLWLACAPDGTVRGYLFLAGAQAQGPFFLAGTQLWELAVDDWAATVALLQQQAGLIAAHAVSEKFLYNVPPSSPVARWLVAGLETQDATTWDKPTFGWAVREQTFRHRNAGWMARLVSLRAVAQALLPEWQSRWKHSLAQWRGNISLVVGDEALTLRFGGTELQLLKTPEMGDHIVSLTPQAFVQALFGYSPVATLLHQPEVQNAELVTILSILFSTSQTWIPTSDWF